jgi:alpha-glucosidase
MPSSNVSQTIGNFVSAKAEDSTLLITAQTGYLRITLFSSEVIRITFSKSNDFENHSYAVIGKPSAAKLDWKESTSEIIVQTHDCRLAVQKNPVSISICDLDGNMINEDDTFGTSWIGEQITTYKKLQKDERFIGLGEKTGNLDRRGHHYQNWNTDAYGYHSGTDPLYSSIPFYIGIHNQICYGIFFDNSHKSFFNFGASNNRFASFSADSGEMTYYFIYGKNVPQILKNYTSLTGRMELPPLWSIGYQQCRYSYYPDTEVLSVARTFREKEIPADAIVLDIHYMDKYKIFTWDKKNFSDPKGMIKTLKDSNFHIVIMCDPGIKVEEGYDAYDSGKKEEVFIKYPDGENYTGQVWPGWCHFPDFTNPKTRKWWVEKFKDYVELGVEGFWNDMNEIATWGHGLPENIEFNFDGNPATARKGRNVFGFQMARSTYEGTKALMKGKRPFNLTRSGFAGIQRYSAVWTGDNVSYDEHMMLGVRIVNSLGLSGVAFAGFDAGGFVGNADIKLFTRWMSIASLSPFFRAHTMINTRDSEPWSYGEEAEQICRNYIKLRYQLMPYIYSLFYEASQIGLPIQRSLAINYTHEPKVYDGQYQHQYLFGPSILVAPVESNKELMKVFLPEGEWYYLFDGKKYNGNQEIFLECPIHKLPVFIKAGAVIPMQPSVMSTAEKKDEFILHIYKGNTSNEFDYFTDDGETFSYQQGAYLKRKIIYNPSERKVVLEKGEGDFKPHHTKLKLVFHHLDENEITVNGEKKNLESASHSFFSPLEKYDPIADPDSMGEEIVKSTSIAYSLNQIEINW